MTDLFNIIFDDVGVWLLGYKVALKAFFHK